MRTRHRRNCFDPSLQFTFLRVHNLRAGSPGFCTRQHLSQVNRKTPSRNQKITSYTCGGPVTTATDPLHGRVVARSTLRCSDPVEFSYYAKRSHFPLVCSTCGVPSATDNKMTRDPDRAALYKVVLPQCEACRIKRLVPPTRGNLHFVARPFGRPTSAPPDNSGAADQDGKQRKCTSY